MIRKVYKITCNDIECCFQMNDMASGTVSLKIIYVSYISSR